MRLADRIQDWLTDQEWKDEQERDEEKDLSQVVTRYGIDGQSYRLFLESDGKRDWLKAYLYAPIKAKKDKHMEIYKLFNRINARTGTGKIYLHPDGDICASHIVDVEGCEPSLEMISNLISGPASIYSSWFEEISAVALTKMTAQEIFDELDKAEPEEEVPDAI